MTTRGVEFVFLWLNAHFSSSNNGRGGDISPKLLAEFCFADAKKAGIPEAEIVEEIGNLEVVMRRVIAATSKHGEIDKAV